MCPILGVHSSTNSYLIQNTKYFVSFKKITDTVRAWRGEKSAPKYEDVPGFCKVAKLEDIAKAGYVLTPGRYVGLPDEEDDGVPFEEKMQKERGLGSLPLTPVYDLVVRVVPTINEYCLPQYDEKGTLIQRVDPPGTLPFTVYFALGNETLLGGTAIHYARQESEDGFPYYEWEVKGWPKGIFISEKLEKVITAVQDNDPTLRIGVLVGHSLNNVEKVEKPISFDLCVPLAGGLPHKVINMRGKSAGMNIPTLIGGAEQYRTEGFEMIEPFKTYSTSELNGGKGRYFAHFADLAQHDDTGWSTLFGRFFVGANKKPRALSSCGNDGSQYFFQTKIMLSLYKITQFLLNHLYLHLK